MGKPRILALMCLLTLAGAALSPHFLSPDFPVTRLGDTRLFQALGRAFPRLFTPVMWSGAHALGATAVVALLWLGTAIINDLSDQAIDAVSNPGRPVPSRRVDTALALRWAISAEVLAFVLVLVGGSAGAVYLALIGALLGNTYSLPPVRLRRSGIAANLVIGVGVGMAVVGGQLGQGDVTQTGLLSAVALGLLAAAVSMVKDFKDVAGDREHGVHTLPVLLGVRRAALVNMTACVAGYLIALVLLVEHIGLVWPVIEVFGALATANEFVLARFLANPDPGYASRAYRRVVLIFMGVTVLYVGAQAIH
jgi:chlorophyll synthase